MHYLGDQELFHMSNFFFTAPASRNYDHPCCYPLPQTQAQNEIIEQQRSRVRELETSVRQLEARCADLRDASAGHDQRAKEAQAEVVKGNHIIEKLMVSWSSESL